MGIERMKKKTGLVLSGLCAGLTLATQASNFTTEANGIRKVVPGMNGSTPVLFVSELEGGAACYTTEGEKLWYHPTESQAVLFEIEAADINGDGRDDLVTASGDGSIACWDSGGKLRWRFRPENKVRFSEVAVLKRGKKVQVFAGGNDDVIYELNAKGELISSTKVAGVIRKLEIGDFKKEGEPLLFVSTLKLDKTGWAFFGFLDPDNLKKVEGSLAQRNKLAVRQSVHTDYRVQDFDNDGRDDLMVYINKPLVTVLNGDFEEIFTFQFEGKAARGVKQRYAHALGTAFGPDSDQVLLSFGRAFYVLNKAGQLIGSNKERFAAADVCYHPVTKRLYAAGSVSGDNAVHEFDPSQPEWWNQNTEWSGRMVDVTDNLNTLYKQVLAFQAPAYQTPADKPWVMSYSGAVSEEVKNLDFNKVQFVKQYIWSENYDRSDIIAVVGEEYGKKRDKRKPYKDSQSDLVAKARALEKEGQSFIIWAGHGGDPFYMDVATQEAILEAAPKTCHGFLYAEMANIEDPRVHYFINQIIPRLTKACRKNGTAKIYFRYKQTFWATTVQMEPWKELFLSGKYADVLVPSTEDTNSFTQDLNLSGRVGMFAGGFVNDFGMRLIDDNPTGWRPLAPCQQKSVSPFLRSGVLRAAYGARYGIIWTMNYLEQPGMELLFALMGSGVLPQVEPEQMASIGSWHLLDEVQEKHGHGHLIDCYDAKDVEKVLSLGFAGWGGASVPDHDFSRLGLGVHYRWLSFIPEMPYGMIPMASIDLKDRLTKRKSPVMISNGEQGQVRGKWVSAETFGAEITKTAKAGAARLPVVVSGASWSSIRLDETHYRLVILDPHYLDPRDCDVTLTFQAGTPKSVRDILSKEPLTVTKNQAELTVPAGSMRFVDIEF